MADHICDGPDGGTMLKIVAVLLTDEGQGK